MNACTLFAWWGFNLWLPGFLALPVAQGGVGLSTATMSGFVVAMQVGMWFGYVTFGFISDRARAQARLHHLPDRRRRAAVHLRLGADADRAAAARSRSSPSSPPAITRGFGAVTAEVYPTAIRATAQGFTYNIGRVASAVAPYAVGSLAQTRGFSAALSICSVAFLLAAFTWIWIPETRGRELV